MTSTCNNQKRNNMIRRKSQKNLSRLPVKRLKAMNYFRTSHELFSSLMFDWVLNTSLLTLSNFKVSMVFLQQKIPLSRKNQDWDHWLQTFGIVFFSSDEYLISTLVSYSKWMFAQMWGEGAEKRTKTMLKRTFVLKNK